MRMQRAASNQMMGEAESCYLREDGLFSGQEAWVDGGVKPGIFACVWGNPVPIT